MRRIRKHFESDIDSPELISTIHGEGYRFVGKIRQVSYLTACSSGAQLIQLQ
ncbi:hypothetical protein [Arsukibacterium sp.]|uniref:hypothetical protein n=1 Tax=Arsukibacterium sp. TaxID=1977258 RepID=UPI00343BD793